MNEDPQPERKAGRMRTLRRKFRQLIRSPELEVAMIFVPWTALILAIAFAARLAIAFVSNQSLPLSERLNLVLTASTVLSVVVAAVYARLTARTVGLMREERIGDSEPTLVVDVSYEPADNSIRLVVENHGRGPALRVEVSSIVRRADGGPSQTLIDIYPRVITVASAMSTSISISAEAEKRFKINGLHQDFLTIELKFNDARRNSYVQTVTLAAHTWDRYRGLQIDGEHLTRREPDPMPFVAAQIRKDRHRSGRVLFAWRRNGMSYWDW